MKKMITYLVENDQEAIDKARTFMEQASRHYVPPGLQIAPDKFQPGHDNSIENKESFIKQTAD